MSAIHDAARQGDLSVFKHFLALGSRIGERDAAGMTPLHSAAFAGQCGIAAYILDQGFPVDSQDGEGSTALFFAAVAGKADMVRFLLGRGAFVDARNHGHYTPLLVACEEGHSDAVKILLEAGADVNVISRSEGITPFLAARSGGHEQILSLLKQAADIKSLETPSPEGDREALKAYWRKAARSRWSLSPAEHEVICHKCWQTTLQPGEGYWSEIFGDLVCEACAERRLTPDRIAGIYNDSASVTKNELRMARELQARLKHRP